MSYLFTSESVSEGHPDKIADQISDAILDNYLAFDRSSKVACECLVTTNQIILAGEIKSSVNINHERIARDVVKKIGYESNDLLFDYKSCDFKSFLHNQSPDINRGVEKKIKENQGAGDQGIMFGYACNETENFMPVTLDLSHKILIELAELRRENKEITYLRPDSKSQITLEYDEKNNPGKIKTLVLSTQHDEFDKESYMLDKIKNDIKKILIPRLIGKYPDYEIFFTNDINYHVNPTGKFVIGGPHGDSGLTGRKIIVDTYGGRGAHGGGAFSGKDPSKVDRSAAYATRHLAKNLVASGLCDRVLVQVGYAIGVDKPTGINLNTFGTAKLNISDLEISKIISKIIDLRPYSIVKKLKLRNPIYLETAAYGHMGRQNEIKNKIFNLNNKKVNLDVDLFPWEKLDYKDIFMNAFNI